MAVKTIDWGDGSGDLIKITYGTLSGNQTLSVASDPNTGSKDRTKTITFKTIVGTSVTKTLTVTQKAVAETVLNLNPSAFVSGSYSSISGQTNPVGKTETNTTYATVNLRTGSNAVTYAFWKFDTSSIPANATIISVTCKAKGYISNQTSNRIGTRQIQMYSGTGTAKGSASTLTTTATTFTINCGTWTRTELNNCYIRLYAKRGTSGTSTSYNMRFYGATVTITYK